MSRDAYQFNSGEQGEQASIVLMENPVTHEGFQSYFTELQQFIDDLGPQTLLQVELSEELTSDYALLNHLLEIAHHSASADKLQIIASKDLLSDAIYFEPVWSDLIVHVNDGEAGHE
jgi:hypothetical protein